MFIPSSIPKGPRAKRGQGFPFSGQRFRQGDRVAYNVVLPMTVLSQMIDTDRIGAKDNQMNRELKKAHLESCDMYLDQEPEFVLGGVVLAAHAAQIAFRADDDEINEKLEKLDSLYFEAAETADEEQKQDLIAKIKGLNDEVEVCSGQLWIPYGVRLEVTDGQHRIQTLLDRTRGGDQMLVHPSQGLAAMIMIEPRTPKRQQDFVDLGQTAPIHVNIKIGMDHRQPLTKLIKTIVEEVPIFAERFIEFKRPSIRRTSDNLYSLSNLKTAVQAMILGNTRMSAPAAHKKMTGILDGEDAAQVRHNVLEFFRQLSLRLGVFSHILEDPDAASYQELRAEYICLNSIGLGAIGMVGHDVIRGTLTVEQAVEAVAQTDWKRTNPLWNGTLLAGGKIGRGGNLIELGGAIVKASRRLPLTQRDKSQIVDTEGLSELLSIDRAQLVHEIAQAVTTMPVAAPAQMTGVTS
ncbi:MAG: DNA sulfur modification protein DndB [Pseudomonadota bacterium]